jgi:flagellar biosynthesis protein FlhB
MAFIWKIQHERKRLLFIRFWERVYNRQKHLTVLLSVLSVEAVGGVSYFSRPTMNAVTSWNISTSREIQLRTQHSCLLRCGFSFLPTKKCDRAFARTRVTFQLKCIRRRAKYIFNAVPGISSSPIKRSFYSSVQLARLEEGIFLQTLNSARVSS